MERLNATQRYFIEEHIEDFRDGLIPRRELVRRVTIIAGSTALAATVLAACDLSPRQSAATSSPASSPSASASAQPFATPPAQPTSNGITVQENDPRIRVLPPNVATVKGADGATLISYTVRPIAQGHFGSVLVVHENRGLTEHIKDVVRRVATAGFVGLGIDLLSRAGGADTLKDAAAYQAELAKRSTADMVADVQAALAFLKQRSEMANGSLGVVGFCFGGGMVWSAVAAGADLKAAVPYYGPQPANYTELAKTKTAVFAVYAEQDTRITGTAPQMEEQLKKSGTPYQITVYPGVNHAFHNDTNAAGDRYNPAQAQKAWVSTIEWFRRYLA
jgi:carboxymethylenebutenolidase